jgi:hydrogenase nickel incorporation protein HypA/HybF
MHELSIALGIVDIAEKEVIKAKADRVEEIELLIGTLSGVEMDALTFVWPSAVKDTVLEKAKRKIFVVEAKGKCLECENVFSFERYYDNCPVCHSYFKEILEGKELKVKRLILEKD